MHDACRHSPFSQEQRRRGKHISRSLSLTRLSFLFAAPSSEFFKALQELRRPIRYTHFMAPYPTDWLYFFAREGKPLYTFDSQKYLYDPSIVVKVGKQILLCLFGICPMSKKLYQKRATNRKKRGWCRRSKLSFPHPASSTDISPARLKLSIFYSLMPRLIILSNWRRTRASIGILSFLLCNWKPSRRLPPSTSLSPLPSSVGRQPHCR